jgi:hypothetical protein
MIVGLRFGDRRIETIEMVVMATPNVSPKMHRVWRL